MKTMGLVPIVFLCYPYIKKWGDALNYIAKDGDISIRFMEPTEQDFNLYLKWMTDPETMRFWEGMTVHFTYETVVRNYKENRDEQVEQCIIEYKGAPIGFCQYCLLDAENFEVPRSEFARFASQGETVYGIDIFIGEVPLRNCGLGTRVLSLLVRFLFEMLGADVIMIDPKVHNKRAIRCYHKCGFQDYFVVPHRELQDGIYHDSLIMGIRKQFCKKEFE